MMSLHLSTLYTRISLVFTQFLIIAVLLKESTVIASHIYSPSNPPTQDYMNFQRSFTTWDWLLINKPTTMTCRGCMRSSPWHSRILRVLCCTRCWTLELDWTTVLPRTVASVYIGREEPSGAPRCFSAPLIGRRRQVDEVSRRTTARDIEILTNTAMNLLMINASIISDCEIFLTLALLWLCSWVN